MAMDAMPTCSSSSSLSSPPDMYYPSDMGCPDILIEWMDELVDDEDNSRMLSNSPAVPPLPMQQLFNPMDIRNTSR